MKPHGYQIDASNSIFDYFVAHPEGNPLLAMPTATGKSVVIAIFLQRIFQLYARQRVLVLTHSRELVLQDYEKLLAVWPGAPAGINSAALGQRDTLAPIIFGSIGSVHRHADRFGQVHLIIIDEAHLISPDEETMYQSFFNDLRARNPALRVIGFTATPWRAGYGLLTEAGLFTDFCFNITYMAAFNWLIHEGYLCPLIPMRTKVQLDTSGVHMRGSDFIVSELQAAVNKTEITVQAVAESLRNGADTRQHWLTFCAGVEHAIDAADILNANGISSVAIHSKMSKGERDDKLLGWKEGYWQCATNNNVLTTGIDFPALDFIMMLRPTASTNLWVQMLGRGTRPLYAPGFDITDSEQRMEAIRLGGKENCLVHDYAGNTARLGPINDPVLPRKKGDKRGDPPIRICENCGMYNHASAHKCAACGYEFPPGGMKIKTEASRDALIIGNEPIVEVFKIDYISYSSHSKLGAPDSMRVSYQCGIRTFNEYVCLEHPGWAGKRAGRWWKEHAHIAPDVIAKTVSEAIDRATDLKVPSHLRVWVNKKYPEIMSYLYEEKDLPTVQRQSKRSDQPPAWDGDDIPF